MATRWGCTMWEPHLFQNETGSGYDGVPIAAEEHTEGAVISLEERGLAPYSITVIIYGTMLHTAMFETIDEATATYEIMKQDIQKLFDWWDNSVSSDDVFDWCQQFVNRYP